MFAHRVFHMTSQWPFWCPQLILWELDSLLMLTFPFVLVQKHPHWSCEWKHCICLFFIEVLHGFIRTPKCFCGKERAGNCLENSVFSLKHNHIHNHMYSQWERMSSQPREKAFCIEGSMHYVTNYLSAFKMECRFSTAKTNTRISNLVIYYSM